MEILIFIALLFALVFYEVPKLLELLRASSKHPIRIAIHVFVFIFTVFITVFYAAFPTETVHEEFSFEKGNIKFEGKANNLVLYPSKKVVEEIDLRNKNTFGIWQPQVHYVVRPDNSIFLNFIYGDNQDSNRQLAFDGLTFTYKTKAFVLNRLFKVRSRT